MRTLGSDARPTTRPDPTAALFLSAFAGQASVLVLSPLLPRIAEALDSSIGAVGQVRTVSGALAGVAAIALARIRGLELRRLIAAGLVLLATGALAGAAARSVPLLALAQVPTGLGLAAVLVGAIAATVEWTDRARRTRLLAWTLVGQAGSWVVGMPVVGLLAGAAGWRSGFAALPVTSCAAALIALRWAPGDRRSSPSDEPGFVRQGPVARWVLGELLAFSAWTGTLVFAGSLFAVTYGTGRVGIGLLLGLGAAAYFPGNFLARRWVERSAATASAVFALLGAGVALALFTVRQSLPVSAALFAAMGAVGGARTLAGSARGLQLAGDHPLSSTGVRAAAQQFGYLVGAAVGGLAFDAAGPPGLGVVVAVLFVAAAVVAGSARSSRA